MKKNKPLGFFSRLAPATKNSWAGFKAAYKYEMAFRQEVLLFITTTPLAIWLANGFIEFVLLMSGIVIIFIAELLNSAIETVVDRIGVERHELSGRAKDLGSAAVFVALCYFALVWLYKIYTLL
ncbi:MULTISPECIES: diacylglycerol kinase [unclassified Colwellia]|jgi:diacylglycerol kinase (ATP)|uniref:diacylglycerol kinase n=1 Tax=unclassified Colwellia TaxID=196834 RepID=UPI0015F6A661|nr:MULTISPECIES: diacylglycerol kinase [unclassified Colwellia]MBA6231477.1 diacylglycerol kinase [Colwellia sp. MB02u-7]MBA6238432.1 diacylglycerol kinase [Colwellia sp. MB02u-11]MBA6255206.1 diacylglycerol kinase [Colwellia sp. MB3u-28]MBA6260781.1 diacylglycerol kinase [Colwellia sp. MB3u-41]MBA6263281.1 diacylglycerol kinase [Colwellia sp. Bg11-12]